MINNLCLPKIIPNEIMLTGCQKQNNNLMIQIISYHSLYPQTKVWGYLYKQLIKQINSHIFPGTEVRGNLYKQINIQQINSHVVLTRGLQNIIYIFTTD